MDMNLIPEVSGVEYDRSLAVFDSSHFDGIFDPENPAARNTLLRDIFALFREESGRRVVELQYYAGSDGDKQLRELIHSISGSAANLGLARLAALCRGVEKSIHSGQPFDLEACRMAVRGEYEAACAAFSADLLRT
jgi:HPt (histidine-containing phosphotransfer) domain-containing protein